MTSPNSSDAPAAEPIAYGSFTSRARALVTDMLVVTGAAMVLIAFAAVTAGVPGTGRIAVIGLFALIFLYEPVMVWRLGGTVGHRRANLRVVVDATGRPPGLPRAFARFAIKGVLGLISFATMALTRRHQAVHDSLTGTTVRIWDLGSARDWDVRWEREVSEVPGLPSRTRRAVVIASYVAGAYLGLAVAIQVALSDACVFANRCSAGEELASQVLGLAWLGASAALIIAGWRGRLWGCRPQRGVGNQQPGDGN